MALRAIGWLAADSTLRIFFNNSSLEQIWASVSVYKFPPSFLCFPMTQEVYLHKIPSLVAPWFWPSQPPELINNLLSHFVYGNLLQKLKQIDAPSYSQKTTVLSSIPHI
jgi:hypothetical protein